MGAGQRERREGSVGPSTVKPRVRQSRRRLSQTGPHLVAGAEVGRVRATSAIRD